MTIEEVLIVEFLLHYCAIALRLLLSVSSVMCVSGFVAIWCMFWLYVASWNTHLPLHIPGSIGLLELVVCLIEPCHFTFKLLLALQSLLEDQVVLKSLELLQSQV